MSFPFPRGLARVLVTVMLLLLDAGLSAQEKDALDAYVQRLRADHAGPRNETGFLTAGSDFLYGQDLIEARNHGSAVSYFRDAARKQDDNAFAHYQLGVALLHDHDAAKQEEGRKHVERAFTLNAALRKRFDRDVPTKPVAAAVDQPREPEAQPAQYAATLRAYIDALEESRRVGGPLTAMNTAGQEALAGIEYYEMQDFDSAATRFHLALAQDAQNPHLHYLLAVSLAAQGKTTEAEASRRLAVTAKPALAASYAPDVAAGKSAWERKREALKPKTTPSAASVPGGALVFGNYVCHHTVWNGPNAVPAFRSDYKGYFELKSDGTYRWLDDGETGRYRYDEKTGEVTWLSGYFKTIAKTTRFHRDGPSGGMTIEFSDSYRWSCFCQKR